MRKLLCLLLSVVITASLGIGIFAVSPKPAVILDASYQPIHDRPVVDLVDGNGNLITEYAIAEPITVINDDSYTPIHDHPVKPLFDEQGNPTFETDSQRAAKKKACPWCGKSLKPVSKALYETAPCGHNVYFKGYVCRDWKGCGYQQVDKWIYTCNCNR